MKFKVLLILILILPLTSAGLFNSKDITLSLDQKDYYFKVGEDAVIPLHIDNTYGKTISGQLSYSITQQSSQPGFQVSSSNTQSTSFSIEDGEDTAALSFGTSNNPVNLIAKMVFSYNEKEQRMVSLDEITIHFVSNDSQKQNQQDKQSSSSEKASQQQNQNQAQDPFQQMQKRMDEAFGRQQQSQSAQQRLQNNQVGQDSSALQRQIQRQSLEQQKLKEQFQETLGQNQEFQKEHQTIIQKGYNLTSGDLNPTSSDTGDFKLNYKKQNGEQATLKGRMEKGKITKIQSLTKEDKREILEKLRRNKDFQKFSRQLDKENFNQTDMGFSLEENSTKIKINYKNPTEENAEISADYLNGTVENVELEDEHQENKSYFWLWIPILLFLIGIVSYLIYSRYLKNKKKVFEVQKAVIKREKPFDYIYESKKLLEKAKKLFEEEKYKDAYGTAGQSLRLYLSYKYGLKKEITNDEIIRHLMKINKEDKKIKECFDLCSLVEFAKYKANKKDFDKIVSNAERIIK